MYYVLKLEVLDLKKQQKKFVIRDCMYQGMTVFDALEKQMK